MDLNPQVSRQKMLQIKSSGISIEPLLNPKLVDFLVACGTYSTELLVNVSIIKGDSACGTDRV